MAAATTGSQAAEPHEAPQIDWQAALAEHDRWLRTVLHARLTTRDEVDEVMQEVSLAAVRQAAPLTDADKVAPWLYRLAVRQALLYRRSLGRRRKLLDRYAARVNRDGQAGDPLDWLLAAERGKLVRQALARLVPRDAEILLLKYAQDWNYGQIAQKLGVSQSAVESRLHRARQKLRDELAKTEKLSPAAPPVGALR